MKERWGQKWQDYFVKYVARNESWLPFTALPLGPESVEQRCITG